MQRQRQINREGERERGSFEAKQQIVQISRFLAAKSGRIIWQNNDRKKKNRGTKWSNLIAPTQMKLLYFC